jgi:hypothetical protein
MCSEDWKETTLPRKIVIVLALLMIGAAGFAQNSGNVFLGYSGISGYTGWSNTGTLNGAEVSVEGKIAPFAGIVADVSSHYGTLQLPTERIIEEPGSVDATTRIATYLFGGRLSHSFGKIEPFAQGLVGAAHLHETVSSPSPEFHYGETCFADAIGGGLDYHLRPRLAWRLQGDFLQTRFHGGLQDDARISTGLAFHF